MLSQIAAIRNYASFDTAVEPLLRTIDPSSWDCSGGRGNSSSIAASCRGSRCPNRRHSRCSDSSSLFRRRLMAMFFRLAEFTASQNVKAPLNDPSLWAFAIPFAFGSLLMTLLADRRTALFTGIFTALLAGLLAPRGLGVCDLRDHRFIGRGLRHRPLSQPADGHDRRTVCRVRKRDPCGRADRLHAAAVHPEYRSAGDRLRARERDDHRRSYRRVFCRYANRFSEF